MANFLGTTKVKGGSHNFGNFAGKNTGIQSQSWGTSSGRGFSLSFSNAGTLEIGDKEYKGKEISLKIVVDGKEHAVEMPKSLDINIIGDVNNITVNGSDNTNVYGNVRDFVNNAGTVNMHGNIASSKSNAGTFNFSTSNDKNTKNTKNTKKHKKDDSSSSDDEKSNKKTKTTK